MYLKMEISMPALKGCLGIQEKYIVKDNFKIIE